MTKEETREVKRAIKRAILIVSTINLSLSICRAMSGGLNKEEDCSYKRLTDAGENTLKALSGLNPKDSASSIVAMIYVSMYSAELYLVMTAMQTRSLTSPK